MDKDNLDIGYKLRLLRHNFAKGVVEKRSIVTPTKVGLLSAFVAVGGIYASAERMEDNIQTEHAPEAMELIDSKITSLLEQKNSIDDIRKAKTLLEFSPSELTMDQLESQESSAVYSFNYRAKETLRYILSNKHMSETQISDAWHRFADEVDEPENIDSLYFSNDYDFGFVKECKADATSYSSAISDAVIATEIDNCLTYEHGTDDKVLPAVLGVHAFFMAIPAMLVLDGKNMKEWAREKPTRKPKHNKW